MMQKFFINIMCNIYYKIDSVDRQTNRQTDKQIDSCVE